jgi:hypothetical protein
MKWPMFHIVRVEQRGWVSASAFRSYDKRAIVTLCGANEPAKYDIKVKNFKLQTIEKALKQNAVEKLNSLCASCKNEISRLSAMEPSHR